MGTMKSTICLTTELHTLVEFVACKYDTTLSQLVRAALRNSNPENIAHVRGTKRQRRYFRTTVNLPAELDGKLDIYSLSTGMSRSAVIRGVLQNYLDNTYLKTSENVVEMN